MKAKKHESFIDHRRRVQDEKRAQKNQMDLIKATNKQINKENAAFNKQVNRQNFADRRKIAVQKGAVGKGIIGFTNSVGRGVVGLANTKAANTAASKFFGMEADVAKSIRKK